MASVVSVSVEHDVVDSEVVVRCNACEVTECAVVCSGNMFMTRCKRHAYLVATDSHSLDDSASDSCEETVDDSDEFVSCFEEWWASIPS